MGDLIPRPTLGTMRLLTCGGCFSLHEWRTADTTEDTADVAAILRDHLLGHFIPRSFSFQAAVVNQKWGDAARTEFDTVTTATGARSGAEYIQVSWS